MSARSPGGDECDTAQRANSRQLIGRDESATEACSPGCDVCDA